MEVVKAGRLSTGSRDAPNIDAEIMRNRVKLGGGTRSDRHPYVNLRTNDHDYDQDQQHLQHPRNRSVKVFNKVQVVYYLTRHGQLEHPHYLEVSHLATQPLRLRDVMERLTVLRGKAMPSQYSWSCKRSYKNGYVWNDLSENDVIYASEGSEYVLKGSELVPHRDFSEFRAPEVDSKGRQQRKSSQVKSKTNELLVSTSAGRSFRQTAATDSNIEPQGGKKLAQCDNNDGDDEEQVVEEEEDKGSCNSSNPPYRPSAVDLCPVIMQMEQDESYSLPSTSSTNSDKLPPPPPPPPPAKPYSEQSKKVNEEDGNPSGLSRNPVLQLIACGGGSMAAKSKPKAINAKANDSNNNSSNSFNFSAMRSSIMPCLKHQLSTREDNMSNSNVKIISSSSSNSNINGAPVLKDQCPCNCKAEDRRVTKEEDDEDMIMVRYMSENPRFGNLQSEEKEYFSGTLVEAMATHHQYTPSSGSASALAYLTPPPVFTKSSSYDEQRSFKSGLQAAAAATEEEQDREKDSGRVTGIIKCIPRRKSCGSSSSKSNKL